MNPEQMSKTQLRLDAEEKRLEALAFGTPEKPVERPVDAPVTPQTPEAVRKVEPQVVVPAKVDTPRAIAQPLKADIAKELALVTNRFNRYKGTMDLKLSGLRKENTQLSTLVLSLRSEVDRLTTASTPEATTYFSDEDEKIFGKEAKERLEAAMKLQHETNVQPLLDAEENRKRQSDVDLENKIKSNKEKTVADFHARLSDLRSTWIDDASDPTFREFLKSSTKYGSSYEDRFRISEKYLDAEALIEIFAIWEAQKGINPELEKHVAPAQGSTVTKPVIPQPNTGVVIDQAYIDAFYAKTRSGYYQQNQALYKEGQEIERRIDESVQAAFNRR